MKLAERILNRIKVEEKFAFDVKGGEQEVKGLLKDMASAQKRLEKLEKMGVDVFRLSDINTSLSRGQEVYTLKKFKKAYEVLLGSSIDSDKVPKKLKN